MFAQWLQEVLCLNFEILETREQLCIHFTLNSAPCTYSLFSIVCTGLIIVKIETSMFIDIGTVRSLFSYNLETVQANLRLSLETCHSEKSSFLM